MCILAGCLEKLYHFSFCEVTMSVGGKTCLDRLSCYLFTRNNWFNVNVTSDHTIITSGGTTKIGLLGVLL